jgi:hypothetical protein
MGMFLDYVCSLYSYHFFDDQFASVLSAVCIFFIPGACSSSKGPGAQ